MREDLTILHAAAGCGKTTELARRYLAQLGDGTDPAQIIAITFTRRAAAELRARVSGALQASRSGPTAAAARRRLGTSWPLYAEVIPPEPRLVERALRALPHAPIGTTDAFVQRLLTEHALHARLPLPDGSAAALDVPIRPGRRAHHALDQAARRLLDPPGGGIDPGVAALLEHLTLDEIHDAITQRSPLDPLPPITATELYDRLAEALARVLLRHEPVSLFRPTDPDDPAAWERALRPATSAGGRWAVPAVSRWLASGMAAKAAPRELTGWLVGAQLRGRCAALRQQLEQTEHDLGMGRLSLWEVVQAVRYPYAAAGHLELSDTLRGRLVHLRRRVVTEGLCRAARSGTLGYEELLEAAIALCTDPPPALHDRFVALLVDEAQDASPGQLRLYRAIARLPGRTPIRAVLVGDVRQSIYLFRHAEPRGLLELPRSETLHLDTNHRSAPALVAAQRALFAALEAPMAQRRWAPLAPLRELRPQPAHQALALDPERHAHSEPVWLLEVPTASADEADRHALAAFIDRLAVARTEPGHRHDTAAVLSPTWRAAHRACALLRRLAGRDDAATVEGSTRWIGSRVGTDVVLFLRALQDPGDDVAWLGVLKHPSVGLTDGALAHLRAAGLLSEVLDRGPLPPPHRLRDRQALRRVAEPLRRAHAQLGRQGTARTLDALVTAMRWRLLLEAGPGGAHDVAELEVLLDWIRTLDDEGCSPDQIGSLLADPASGAPQIHLQHSGPHVTCTTIHQAKGLAFDHVCVLSVGRPPASAQRDAPAWVRLGAHRARVEGIRFDPYGGVTPFLDPLGRLARALHQHRRGEESARLAYVAMTRARRSITVGLPSAARSRERDVSTLLRDAWLDPDLHAPGVARLPAPPLPQAPLPRTGWVAADPDPEPLAPIPGPQPVRLVCAPSALSAHLSSDQRQALVRAVVAQIDRAGGLLRGAPPLDPPTAPPLRQANWGEIAHGWLARWGLRDPLEPRAVDAYLRTTWGAAHPGACSWLLSISSQLRALGGPLWDQAQDPAARLHFELPFVGVADPAPGGDRGALLSGCADLLIERAGRRLWIVDFKGGRHAPLERATLEEAAHLGAYGPQLEAYAAAFSRMGYTVQRVALWFVRSGAAVWWTPTTS